MTIDPTAPRLTSLREYAQHKEGCAVDKWLWMNDGTVAVPDCTCGLSALLSVPSPQPEASRAQVIRKLTKAASWETGPLETKQLIDEALALLQQEGTT